jgi:hypothetical protein
MTTLLHYRDDLLNEIKDLSDDQLSSLLKIIRIFKETLNRQRENDFALQKEWEEWDALSDEALNNYEAVL